MRTSVPLDIRETYMNKYFEYGDFMKQEYVDWQKLYNYLRTCHLMKTTQRNDERYSS